MKHDKKGVCKKQILTIPNAITLFRILLIGPVIWAYGIEQSVPLALALIALSGLSDIVDGRIARKYGLVSDFGKILDPVADKLMQAALLFCLTTRHQTVWLLIAVMGVKEMIMVFYGLLIIEKKDVVNSAQWHGKLATVFLYTLAVVLFVFPDLPDALVNTMIGVSAGLILLSLVLYCRFYIGLLKTQPDQERIDL